VAHVEHRRIPTVEHVRARGGELVEQAGEQRLEVREPGAEHHVQMPPLRRAAALNGTVGQHVSFHQRDGVEEVREYPRREQARHAGAAHDGASALVHPSQVTQTPLIAWLTR
jgi:hypothetical protein